MSNRLLTIEEMRSDVIRVAAGVAKSEGLSDRDTRWLKRAALRWLGIPSSKRPETALSQPIR